MKFDLWIPTASPMTTVELLDAVGRESDARGISTLWVGEHVVLFDQYASRYPYAADGKIPAPSGSGLLDPVVTLSYLAACTKSVRLGTAMLLLPQRNPVYVAKEVSSLDWLSGGRVDLGIGVGWLKEEFEALGVPFAGRAHRTEEAIAAMRALWSDEEASYEGTTTSFHRCFLRPQPVGGAIPVHVGGHSEGAARRAGRIGDGFFPLGVSPAELPPLIDIIRQSATAAGRDPNAVEVTIQVTATRGEEAVADVAMLQELGVSRVLVPAGLFGGDVDDSLARYGEDVIGRF